MSQAYGRVPNDPSSTVKVTATNASSSVAITADRPVHLYRNAAGTLLCANAVIDGSSKKGNYGIADSAIASGAESSDIIIKGAFTVLEGGTAGQLITSIAAGGSITDAAAASANTDLAIGVSTAAGTGILY